ncbi:hypothetical protein PS2_002090 [Malus domestica]
MLSQNFSSAAAIGSSTTSSSGTYGESKKVWVWTESRQVMTAAIKRGWNTFVFPFQSRELADEWSYLKTGGGENKQLLLNWHFSESFISELKR